MEKTIKEMQQDVDQFVSQFKVGYFSPLAQLARLTEEVGELAREINHQYGEKQKKSIEKEKAMIAELGDVLFVLTALANSLEIDLTQSFQETMNKLNNRDKNRFERKDEAHD
ncbi:nucleotide pyrophosphohydrolase [Isobaculum melis]|uniref:NTP pyrophosphatase, house-cleaning of non-canonical NTPs n=1 Tax=Isobaculum melis TaxID=142588 RepID=A0A1H9R830_9LACT|nr:nucleotide pyrophosphohydrolase [Isobaculum melis]SER69051.1 NTP pyrophosphatase, house-cleaning of non-canonical NTPs [Isobaculum melis]